MSFSKFSNFPIWLSFDEPNKEGYTNPSYLPGKEKDDTSSLHSAPVFDSKGFQTGHHASTFRIRENNEAMFLAKINYKENNGNVTTYEAAFPKPPNAPDATSRAVASENAVEPAPVLIGTSYCKPTASNDLAEVEKIKELNLYGIPGFGPNPRRGRIYLVSLEDAKR